MSSSDPVPTEEFIGPGQAARLLHVSPKTVDRWAAAGRIPCIVTLGGHRRFRTDDVKAVAETMAAGGAQSVDKAPSRKRRTSTG